MLFWPQRRTDRSDMKDTIDYREFHLDEPSFGDTVSTDETAEDLMILMAEQIRDLVKIILWFRCVYDGLLIDMNSRNIRKMSVDDLTGAFTATQGYKDFVKYNCRGRDPLDLSDYVSILLSIYNQRQLLKQASR